MKWQRQGKNQRHEVSLQADKLQSKTSQSFDILSCRCKIWLHDDNSPWNAEAVFFEKMSIVSLIFSGPIYFCAFPVRHPLIYSSQAQRRKRAAQKRLRTWRAVQTYSLLFFAKSDLSCQANPNLTNGLLCIIMKSVIINQPDDLATVDKNDTLSNGLSVRQTGIYSLKVSLINLAALSGSISELSILR